MKDLSKVAHRKFWRIHIHSQSVLAGDWRDGTYFIDVPTTLDNNCEYQIAVEAFYVSNAVTTPYVVTSPTLPQGNSYSTLTSNSAGFNLLVNTGSSFSRQLNFTSIGCKLQDMAYMRGQNHRIRITGLDGNLIDANAFGVTPSWVMTLVVFPITE